MIQSKIQSLAVECVKNHIDMSLALNDLELEVQALPEFPDLQRTLIRNALRQVLHQVRNQSNQATRKANSLISQTTASDPKVIVLNSRTVKQISKNIADSYFLGGKRLGDLYLQDLEMVAVKEQASAEGHRFNVSLCEQLMTMVGDNGTVRDYVSEKELRKLFRNLQKEKMEKAVS